MTEFELFQQRKNTFKKLKLDNIDKFIEQAEKIFL